MTFRPAKKMPCRATFFYCIHCYSSSKIAPIIKSTPRICAVSISTLETFLATHTNQNRMNVCFARLYYNCNHIYNDLERYFHIVYSLFISLSLFHNRTTTISFCPKYLKQFTVCNFLFVIVAYFIDKIMCDFLYHECRTIIPFKLYVWRIKLACCMHRRKFTISQINQAQRGNQFNNLHRICFARSKDLGRLYANSFLKVWHVWQLQHSHMTPRNKKCQPTKCNVWEIIFSPVQWRADCNKWHDCLKITVLTWEFVFLKININWVYTMHSTDSTASTPNSQIFKFMSNWCWSSPDQTQPDLCLFVCLFVFLGENYHGSYV